MKVETPSTVISNPGAKSFNMHAKCSPYCAESAVPIRAGFVGSRLCAAQGRNRLLAIDAVASCVLLQ